MEQTYPAVVGRLETPVRPLAALLRTHGRADDLNALAADTKRLKHSEREAIEAIQACAMLAATELDRRQWVSVADRLPPDDRWVLVFNGKHVGTGRYVDDCDEPSERWQDEHSEYIEHLSRTKVTHWMLMPERPNVRAEPPAQQVGA